MTASLSGRDIRAILKMKADVEKRAQKSEREAALREYSDAFQGGAEALVAGSTVIDKPDSTWAGFNVSGVPVTIDGRQYTATLRLTDVERCAEKLADAEKVAQEFLETVEAPETADETADETETVDA